MTPLELCDAEVATEASMLPIKVGIGILRQSGKVGIVGSREYPQPESHDRVDALISALHADTTVVSGGGGPIDQRAASAANARGLRVIEITPYELQDRQRWIASAFIRNRFIALCSDVVVAFWNGSSNGTKSTIEAALSCSGKCIVVLPGQPPQVWVPKITTGGKR